MLGSTQVPIGSFLSTVFQIYLPKCWDPYVSPGCMIRLAFFRVFLPCFCMLILSLPLLVLDVKSTSLNPWSAYGAKAVRYELLEVRSHFWILCFFLIDCLGGWNGINKCGWCLTGGRGCWLKGPWQIPNVSWLFHHSLHFHIY